MAWQDLEGVTRHEGAGRLPANPERVVVVLDGLLRRTRDDALTPSALTASLHNELGGDRARLAGVVDWLLGTRVARLDADGRLDVHPGTHLQDLAYRLAAFAGQGGFSRREPSAAMAEPIGRWAHALLSAARSHERALLRRSSDPEVARDWLAKPLAPSATPAGPPPAPSALAHKLRQILDALDGALLERRVHIRAVLLALLAGQHALLLGPPGTAKSLLARALCGAFQDATYFEYLLSRFTHPDELFGPVSIPGLKNEDYRRLTEGFLPRAHVAFLDEIFKANSAILNALLTLVNERVFHHGRHRDPAPLLGLVGASNELPAPDAGLDALYDRFLVRLAVPPLGAPEHFIAVATGQLTEPSIPVDAQITLDEIAALRAQARAVHVPDDVAAALASLWEFAREQGWPVSDRRWRQAVGLLKVAAASEGRHAVAPVDLLLLEPCLAWDPTEAPQVQDALLAHLRPAAAPQHDLAVQWGLLWSDSVAPTLDDPVPPGDPPTRWQDCIERRQRAVQRFLTLHRECLDALADDRAGLEDTSADALWLERLPPALLEPHLAAARDLSEWLERAELYAHQLSTPDRIVASILGWLPTEDRVRPEHMDLVMEVGDGLALGRSYRQWRRLPAPFEGHADISVSPQTFLDWLDGRVPHTRLTHGLDVKQRRTLEHALPVLHEALVRERIPKPPAGRAPS